MTSKNSVGIFVDDQFQIHDQAVISKSLCMLIFSLQTCVVSCSFVPRLLLRGYVSRCLSKFVFLLGWLRNALVVVETYMLGNWPVFVAMYSSPKLECQKAFNRALHTRWGLAHFSAFHWVSAMVQRSSNSWLHTNRILTWISLLKIMLTMPTPWWIWSHLTGK